MKTAIQGLFSDNPELKFKVESDDIQLVNKGEDPSLLVKEEVFHVGNNLYNYKEAKAVCKAYGADLADYDQIEKAYMDGASGVVMVGRKINWHCFQHKRPHMQG